MTCIILWPRGYFFTGLGLCPPGQLILKVTFEVHVHFVFHHLSLPPQTCQVFLCGGCRTQSSMCLMSTSTVTSTHHMLRPLQNGVVGNNCSACMS